jgi:hypothetical protein
MKGGELSHQTGDIYAYRAYTRLLYFRVPDSLLRRYEHAYGVAASRKTLKWMRATWARNLAGWALLRRSVDSGFRA